MADELTGASFSSMLPLALMGGGAGLANAGRGNPQAQGEVFRMLMEQQRLGRQQAGEQNAGSAVAALDALVGQRRFDEAQALHQGFLQSGALGTEGLKALIPYGENIAKQRASHELSQRVADQVHAADPLAAGLLRSGGIDVKTALDIAQHVRSSGDWQEVADAFGNKFAVNKFDPSKKLQITQGMGFKAEPGAAYVSPTIEGGLTSFTVPKRIQWNDFDKDLQEHLAVIGKDAGINPNRFNELAVSREPGDQAMYGDLVNKAALRNELLKRNPAVTADALMEAKRLGIALDPVAGFGALKPAEASALLNATDQRIIRRQVDTEIAKYTGLLQLPVTKALPDLKGKIIVDRTNFQRVPADKITGQQYLSNENMFALSPQDADIVSYATNDFPTIDRLRGLTEQLKKATEGRPGATLGQALGLVFRDKTQSDSAVAAFKQDAFKLTVTLGRIYGNSSRVPVTIVKALADLESPKLTESLENTLTKVDTIAAELTNQRNGRVGLPPVAMPDPAGMFTVIDGVRVRRNLLSK